MAEAPNNMKIEKRGTAEFTPIADLGVPPEERVRTVEVDPAQMGWRLSGRTTSRGQNIWITDDGAEHVFPPGQGEQLTVRLR